MALLDKMLHMGEGRQLKKLKVVADQVNLIEPDFEAMSDDELAAFRRAGFDDAVALEVVALVALNTLTNYTNHLAGTAVDFPPVPLEITGWGSSATTMRDALAGASRVTASGGHPAWPDASRWPSPSPRRRRRR